MVGFQQRFIVMMNEMNVNLCKNSMFKKPSKLHVFVFVLYVAVADVN